MKSDICIIGGGPAGLAAALALAQSGREVAVIDCAVPPIDKACGEGLMPDSLCALRKLGVIVPDEAGVDLLGIRFSDAESEVSGEFQEGAGRGLRRVLLHQQMISAAVRLGIRLLWGVKNVRTQRGRVSFTGGEIETQLIIGADGQKSAVRQQAGLQPVKSERHRHGFRRHYAVTNWPPYVEVHWGDGFQIYITPIAPNQVCVAVLSSDPHLRLDAAIRRMPALAKLINQLPPVTREMGSMSVSRKLHRVFCEGYVLIGDASGSVDAITGAGLCLAFEQSHALVEALEARDMCLYQSAHRRIGARPFRMSALLRLLESSGLLQRKILAGLAANPDLFSSLISIHGGTAPLRTVFSRHLLSFGLGALCG